jgi:hypothetical protein
MKHRLLTGAICLAAAVACSDANDPSLVSDADINADLMVAAGDAIVDDVAALIGNEVFSGLPAGAPGMGAHDPAEVTITRSRTCYADNVAQDACDALTTDSIVLTMTMDGSVSRQATGPRGTFTMNRAIHRARNLTISGLEGTETSRTHNGSGTSADTTQFSSAPADGIGVTRHFGETSVDSIQQIVFNLPRSTNPWPASGQIVRVAEGTATFTLGARTETRTFSRRIVVTFPADAQGNVTIQINSQTCTLNLVTRIVSNCQ